MFFVLLNYLVCMILLTDFDNLTWFSGALFFNTFFIDFFSNFIFLQFYYFVLCFFFYWIILSAWYYSQVLITSLSFAGALFFNIFFSLIFFFWFHLSAVLFMRFDDHYFFCFLLFFWVVDFFSFKIQWQHFRIVFLHCKEIRPTRSKVRASI